jgi:hypothetical protein
MFHRVRSEVLQTALDRLEPRPLGRPALQPSPHDLRVAELEEKNLGLQLDLKAAEVRRELAEKLPRLAKPKNIEPAPEPGKKTTARSQKRQRKRLQRNTNRPQP